MLVFKIVPSKFTLFFSGYLKKKKKVIILNNRPRGEHVVILCIVAAT